MTDIECRNCTDALTALMDNELTADEVSALQNHLSQCTSCNEEYESLLYTYELANRIPEVEVSPDLWLEIRSSLVSGSPLSRWPQSLYRLLLERPWVPATATLATLGIALFLMFGIPTENPKHEEFSTFVQQREILFKRDRKVLFQGGNLNRLDTRRNPFMREVQYTGQNPFRSR